MRLPRRRRRNSTYGYGNLLLFANLSLGKVGSHVLGVAVSVWLHPGVGLPRPALLLRVAAIHTTMVDAVVAAIHPLGNRRPSAEVGDAEGCLAGLRPLSAIVVWACIDIGVGKKSGPIRRGGTNRSCMCCIRRGEIGRATRSYRNGLTVLSQGENWRELAKNSG